MLCIDGSRDLADNLGVRIRYLRFADDFLLGVVGDEAIAVRVREEVGAYLQDQLHLWLNRTKTHITHATTAAAVFLGYALQVEPAPTAAEESATVHVRIPSQQIANLVAEYQRNGTPAVVSTMLTWGDAALLAAFQHRFMGIAEHYKYAENRADLCAVADAMEASLVATLARKHRIKAAEVERRYRAHLRIHGNLHPILRVPPNPGMPDSGVYWGGVSLAVIDHYTPHHHAVDWQKMVQSKLVVRLQAGICERCGTAAPVEIHQVPALGTLRRFWRQRGVQPAWVTWMVQTHHTNIVVCAACHRTIHPAIRRAQNHAER